MRKETQSNGISVRKNRPQSVNIWILFVFCGVVAIYDYMITDFGVHFICANQLNPFHPLDLQSKRKVSKKCYLCKKLTKGER